MSISVKSHRRKRRIVAELDALQAEVDALKRLQAEREALLPSISTKLSKENHKPQDNPGLFRSL